MIAGIRQNMVQWTHRARPRLQPLAIFVLDFINCFSVVLSLVETKPLKIGGNKVQVTLNKVFHALIT
jgi:hypothetical protein